MGNVYTRSDSLRVVAAEPLLTHGQDGGEGLFGFRPPAMLAPHPGQLVPGGQEVGVVAADLLLICGQANGRAA